MLERCHGVDAAGAFLDGGDAAFDVRYMLFLSADVEVGVQAGSDGAAGAFKLRVAKDNGSAEASLRYTPLMSFSALMTDGAWRLGRTAAVMNRISRDMERKKGILFTNIISIQSVMSRYCAMMAFGMFARLARMSGRVLRVVLPFMEPTSRPKIWCAFIASCLVMGQFGREFPSM
jgi:hypothetical protein